MPNADSTQPQARRRLFWRTPVIQRD